MAVRYPALLLSSNLSLLGCQTRGQPASDEFEEPRILATTAPSAEPVLELHDEHDEEGLGRYCHQNLVPAQSLEQDVHRLGVLCGPSTGLEPLAKASVAAGTSAGRRYRLDATECVRAAIATEQVEPLDVEWRARDRVLERCTVERLGWCPERLPLCLGGRDLGPLEFDVELSFPDASEGRIATRVWHRRD